MAIIASSGTMELSRFLYTSMTNVLSRDQVNNKDKRSKQQQQKDCKLVHCNVLFQEKSNENKSVSFYKCKYRGKFQMNAHAHKLLNNVTSMEGERGPGHGRKPNTERLYPGISGTVHIYPCFNHWLTYLYSSCFSFHTINPRLHLQNNNNNKQCSLNCAWHYSKKYSRLVYVSFLWRLCFPRWLQDSSFPMLLQCNIYIHPIQKWGPHSFPLNMNEPVTTMEET